MNTRRINIPTVICGDQNNGSVNIAALKLAVTDIWNLSGQDTNWTSLFVIFHRHLSQMSREYHHLNHNFFLPHSIQFIFHPHPGTGRCMLFKLDCIVT
jgi:hypothetical protein